MISAQAPAAGWREKARRVCRLIVRYELPILVAAMPAFLFIGSATWPILALLPFLWVCRVIGAGELAPRTPLDVPLLVLLLALLINVLATPSLPQSLPKVANLLFGIALFYALVAWARSGTRQNALVLGVGLAGVLLVLVAGASVAWSGVAKAPAFDPLQAAMERMPASVSLPGAERGVNPNEAAGVLTLFVPFALGAALRPVARQWRPVLAGVFFAALAMVAAACVVLTQSRAGIAGMLAGVLLFVALRYRWGWIVLAVVAVAGVSLVAAGQLEPLLLSSGVLRPGSDVATLNGRLGLWQRALYFMAQAPFTGIGLNQFRLAVPAFWPYSSPLIPYDLGHAHNHFLQVGAEMGLPGLLAYAGVWIALAVRVVAVVRRPAAFPQRTAALAAAAGLGAYLVYGMGDAVALGARAGFVLWLFAGLLVALSSPRVSGNEPTSH